VLQFVVPARDATTQPFDKWIMGKGMLAVRMDRGDGFGACTIGQVARRPAERAGALVSALRA